METYICYYYIIFIRYKGFLNIGPTMEVIRISKLHVVYIENPLSSFKKLLSKHNFFRVGQNGY